LKTTDPWWWKRQRVRLPTAAGVTLLSALVALAQGPQPPAFPAQAEAITVDVVVVGKDDRPVKDLTKGEFTLFEDGIPQTIVGFEPRVLKSAAPAPEAPGDEGAATNEGGVGAAGRTLAFLVDDLGIEPLQMTAAVKALSHWLEHGADPRDEVTLATTSGDAGWSATVSDGGADLAAVLGRLKGKKKLATVNDAMSDWEAYRIETLGSKGDSPGETPAIATGPPSGTASCSTNAEVSNIRDRVVDRWFRTGACLCQPMSVESSIRSCRSQVEARARDAYQASSQRAVGLLGGIERLSRGLAGARGRKSIIVLSETLLRDTQQTAFERAVDASRRGNTAVSFVDVHGLAGLSFLGAEQTTAPKPGEIGALTLEETALETAGGDYMADTTGGRVVHSNDLVGSLSRLADESSAYYLLGYQSDKPQDGKWHKLEVRASRPGLKVRARRGYFATPPGPRVAEKGEAKGKKGLPTRPLDPALAVGGERDDVPLRIAPYVLDTDAAGSVRILVVMEVGTSPLTYIGSGEGRTAQLDVTLLGVSRDQPKTVSFDSHVELKLDAKAIGGWWTFSRELQLPPGAAQIRALVRDWASGRSGMVTERIEIPGPDVAYISTPMLSDRMVPPAGPTAAPTLIPVAHRRFQPRGQLFCQYEVYVAPGGRKMRTIPRVAGGYRLVDDAGHLISAGNPTPIALALGAHLVRLLTFSLGGLAPGAYRLMIQTEDQDTGQNLEAREAFVVEPSAEVPPKSD
jgi:VWFA-related protein